MIHESRAMKKKNENKNIFEPKVKKMNKEDLLKLLEIPISPIRLKCALCIL
jgi:hypothetical protein